MSKSLLLSLCTSVALGRHVHQHVRPLHKHVHPRQTITPVPVAVSPDFTIQTIQPTQSAGDKLMQDIQEIQSGLSDLPKDLFAFLLDMEARLQQMESALENIPTVTPIPVPEGPGPEIPPSGVLPSATSAPDFNETPVSRPTLKASLSISSESLTTTTITSTSTRSHTITWHKPVPVNMTVRPTLNATHISNLKPYPTSNAGLPTNLKLASQVERPVRFQTQASSSPTPTFNPEAHDNLAVYFGTTRSTSMDSLDQLCSRPEVNIVILSFLTQYNGPGGYPSINFAAGCDGPSDAQREAGTTGLGDCSLLAVHIRGCQNLGKKVLLSLGGYVADTSFASDDEAASFASLLWNLFLGGVGDDADLRPFGPETILDGIDLDNENHDSTHYEVFANNLRASFGDDSSKDYYLSAAPQCPIPDASLPLGALAIVDFVWVQFYNNPSCNLGTEGFSSSFAAWNQALSCASYSSFLPKLYIGAPSFEEGGSGYVNGSVLATVVAEALELQEATQRLGGVMLWDGTEALRNTDDAGDDYLVQAKAALNPL